MIARCLYQYSCDNFFTSKCMWYCGAENNGCFKKSEIIKIKEINMNKNEINLKIAGILGFTCNGSGHWNYPEEWKNYVASVPSYSIPDFLEMIDIFLSMYKRCSYGIPKIFNVKPEIKLKMEE